MSLSDDLTSLIKDNGPQAQLEQPVAPDSIRGKTGFEQINQEEDLATELVTVRSTDAVFTFQIRIIK